MSAGAPPDAARLIARLRARGAWVATVESCTGGRVASLLTAVPGSSEVYWGGWVTYDNSAKLTQVGVARELLERHGAVSAEVARALAEGGLREMERATAPDRGLLACLSTTGIAGPSGGSAAKPVGLCHLGLAVAGRTTATLQLTEDAGASREALQNLFAEKALGLLAQALEETEARARK